MDLPFEEQILKEKPSPCFPGGNGDSECFPAAFPPVLIRRYACRELQSGHPADLREIQQGR